MPNAWHHECQDTDVLRMTVLAEAADVCSSAAECRERNTRVRPTAATCAPEHYRMHRHFTGAGSVVMFGGGIRRGCSARISGSRARVNTTSPPSSGLSFQILNSEF
jgi:hypothetical protein